MFRATMIVRERLLLVDLAVEGFLDDTRLAFDDEASIVGNVKLSTLALCLARTFGCACENPRCCLGGPSSG